MIRQRSRGTFIALISVLAAIGCCMVTAEEKSSTSAIEQSKAEAELRAREIAFEREAAVRFHYEQGLHYYRTKEYERAINEFEQLLKIDPEHVRAMKYLDRVRKKLEKEKARQRSQQIRKLWRDAKLYSEREKYAEAIEKLKALLVLIPEHEKGQKLLKESVEKKSQQDLERAEKEAEEEFKEWQQQQEEEINQWLAEAIADYKEGKWDELKAECKLVQERTNPSDQRYKSALDLLHKAELAENKLGGQAAEREKMLAHERELLEVDKSLVPEIEKGVRKRVEEELEVQIPKRKLEEKVQQRVPLIEANNEDIRSVMRRLQEETGVNIVLDEGIFASEEMEGISSQVTVLLRDIPLIEALEVILRSKNLKYRLEENNIWISTAGKFARGDLVTSTFNLSAGAGNIENMLKSSVPWPEGSSISLDPRTGILIVKNTLANMELIEDIVRSLDVTPIQVSIEARFVELSDNVGRNIGTTWDLGALKGLSEDAELDIDFDIFSAPSEGLRLDYTKLSDTSLDLVIQALEQKGDARLLFAPSVTVLNNEEASVRMAVELGFVDSYSIETETVEVMGNDLQVSNLNVEDTTEREVGIVLRATPAVGTDRKTINLTLIPEVIEHAGWNVYGIDRLFNPALNEFLDINAMVVQPVFFVRNVTTVVNVDDGETIILGGLKTAVGSESEKGIPFAKDVPVINPLFKRNIRSTLRQNLLVFVTARIITPKGERFSD